MDEVCELLSDDIAAHNAFIIWNYLRSCAHMRADRIQMQQVLVNLIRNGIEAMNETKEQRRILFVGGRLNDIGEFEREIEIMGSA